MRKVRKASPSLEPEDTAVRWKSTNDQQKLFKATIVRSISHITAISLAILTLSPKAEIADKIFWNKFVK